MKNKKWITIITSLVIGILIGAILTTTFFLIKDTTKLSGYWQSEPSTERQLTATVIDDTLTLSATNYGSTISETYNINTSKKELTSKNKSIDKYQYKINKDTLVLVTKNSGDSIVLHRTTKKAATKSSSKSNTSSSTSEKKNYTYSKYDYLERGEYLVGTDIEPGAYKISLSDGKNAKFLIGDKTINVTDNETRVILKDGDKVEVSGDSESDKYDDLSIELGDPD